MITETLQKAEQYLWWAVQRSQDSLGPVTSAKPHIHTQEIVSEDSNGHIGIKHAAIGHSLSSYLGYETQVLNRNLYVFI